MKTRLVARALIQRGNDVLVNDTKHGFRLLGGRVKPKETLSECLARELKEEIGVRVTVRDIAMVQERMTGKNTRELTVVFRTFVFGDLDDIRSREKGIKPRWVARGLVLGMGRTIPYETTA